MAELPDPRGSTQPEIGDLQFRHAEYEGEAPQLTCAYCQKALVDQFHELGGVPICGACAGRWETNQLSPPAGAVLRGSLYGLGAGIAGAIGMAIIAGVTGFQFSLAAIGVGWLVGKAMRIGTGELGSRRCQIIAVAIAYFGITLSYLPELIRGFAKAESARESKQAAAKLPAEAPAAPATAGGIALGFAFLLVITLAVPFIELGTGFNGVMGILILFFGLAQAWRMTGRDARVLAGPFSTRPEPPPAEADAA